MPRTAPLVYTVQWSEGDSEWKVWKGGALSGRPSRTFSRKAEAESYANNQAQKYNGDGVVIQKKNHRVQNVLQGPRSAGPPMDVYRGHDASIEVEYHDLDASFGWMIVSEWDNGLLGWNYDTKKHAVNTAKRMMPVINAFRVIVRNRQNSGRSETYNQSIPRSELQY